MGMMQNQNMQSMPNMQNMQNMQNTAPANINSSPRQDRSPPPRNPGRPASAASSRGQSTHPGSASNQVTNPPPKARPGSAQQSYIGREARPTAATGDYSYSSNARPMSAGPQCRGRGPPPAVQATVQQNMQQVYSNMDNGYGAQGGPQLIW
eukprot:gnl/MRDRNA2_/MRDRNA2_58201_c0_seq1.p1 gnl/MRDRNA2_/MRDRNA2_58201_c0~~gnl/MRDRNA2_/MRDRNA2_58201_c0_seq1.p1  ORF type:complete len:151 (-),score=14.89 gnl/MRDRNA2_/MRDRNA2_58201_c0_seq1:96-548(-)